MQIHSCRLCQQAGLHLVLDLGRTALANSYVHPSQAHVSQDRYPLRLMLCNECGLVQIDEDVPPDTLFRHYLYVSGTSDLIHRHARFLAEHFQAAAALRAGELIVEAASNDGTMLRAFQARGLRTLGVEPARNIAELARDQGVETLCEFFNTGAARAVVASHGRARLILGRHVLAHVPDLHDFVLGLHELLAADGLAVIEVPHALPMFRGLEYDTIYHEHLCYFSLAVLKTLFARNGLELVDVLEATIHGGSVIVSAQHRGGPYRASPSIDALLAREAAAGLNQAESWEKFSRRVQQQRNALRDEIRACKLQGKRLAAYGAAAKGMTLLAFTDLGPGDIPYVVDKSAHKQGLLTPGHHIPICHPNRLISEQPDVVLLLAWNFADEILQQQAEYLYRGGRFLVPLPWPAYRDQAPTALRWAA